MIRFIADHWNAVEVIAALATCWSLFMLGCLWREDHPKVYHLQPHEPRVDPEFVVTRRGVYDHRNEAGEE